MPRLTPIDPTQATGRTKALLDAVQAALGLVPNMTRTMAQSPAVLEAYLAMNRALGGGRLGARLREQLALAVAEANRCPYCLSAHAALGKGVGLGEAEIAASRAHTSADPKTAAALQLASAIVAQRGDVTDEDLARIRRAGYSEAEIAEIVGHVALNVFTNYFNNVARTEVDFPRVEPGLSKAA